jgi:hypothetical protein
MCLNEAMTPSVEPDFDVDSSMDDLPPLMPPYKERLVAYSESAGSSPPASRQNSQEHFDDSDNTDDDDDIESVGVPALFPRRQRVASDNDDDSSAPGWGEDDESEATLSQSSEPPFASPAFNNSATQSSNASRATPAETEPWLIVVDEISFRLMSELADRWEWSEQIRRRHERKNDGVSRRT